MKRLLPVLLLVLIAPFLASGQQAKPVLTEVDGDVRVAMPGSTEFAPAESGMAVPVGSTIVTGEGASAIVTVLAGTELKISPNTQIVLTKANLRIGGGKVIGQDTQIDLKSGLLLSTIRDLDPANTDFKVKTPVGVAAARGTAYATLSTATTFWAMCAEGSITVSYTDPTTGELVEIVLEEGEVVEITINPDGSMTWEKREANADDQALYDMATFLDGVLAEGGVFGFGPTTASVPPGTSGGTPEAPEPPEDEEKPSRRLPSGFVAPPIYIEVTPPVTPIKDESNGEKNHDSAGTAPDPS